MTSKGDDSRPGLYHKFDVRRVVEAERRRHPNCDYFVLDLDHDMFAPSALMAYAVTVDGHNPKLAADLFRAAKNHGWDKADLEKLRQRLSDLAAALNSWRLITELRNCTCSAIPGDDRMCPVDHSEDPS